MGMDEAFCNGGRWYKLITPKEAFDLRLDVQLYLRDGDALTPDPERYELPAPVWCTGRDNSQSSYWWQYTHYYIEVDSPTKEEYTP